VGTKTLEASPCGLDFQSGSFLVSHRVDCFAEQQTGLRLLVRKPQIAPCCRRNAKLADGALGVVVREPKSTASEGGHGNDGRSVERIGNRRQLVDGFPRNLVFVGRDGD